MNEHQEERIARIRRSVMEPQGLDLLLVYADDPQYPGAVRYLTDFDLYAMYALAALPRAGGPVLAFGLHHSAYLIRVKQAARADHYVGTYKPGALCAHLLAEQGGGGGRPRVGVVGGARMMASIDRDLRAALAHADMMDVDDVFWRAAAALDADAVAAINRCGRIVDAAHDAAGRVIGLAGSMATVAAEASDMARRFGADSLNRELVSVRAASGERLPRTLPLALGDRALSGPVAAVVISATYRGWRALAARTLLRDEAQAHSGLLSRVHDLHHSLCTGARKGITGHDFATQALAQTEAAGFASASNDFGHGVGLDLDMPPTLTLREERPIVAETAVVVRTRVTAEPLGVVHFADTVLVTARSARILTIS